jgi:hypothetical protein
LFDPMVVGIYNSHMEIVKLKAVETEVNNEPICTEINNAYEIWSKDSGNLETVNLINHALNRASGVGVRISVKIKEKVLKHSKLVYRRNLRKLRKMEPSITNEVTLSIFQDYFDAPYSIEGKVFSNGECGFLYLSLTNTDDHKEGHKYDLAFLKPEDIESFTPITP